jgi:hypothetical protein
MVSSRAQSVSDYLASLPPDRRRAVEAVRKVIRKNLPRGFVEGMQYGMIGWYVPLSRYPDTYNGQPLGLAGLASQKQHLSLYLMTLYADPEVKARFERGFAKAGKKLDMGRSCVRFRSADDLPLDVIAGAISRVSVEEFIAMTEAAHGSRKRTRASARSRASAPGKKPAARRARARG